MSKKITIKEIAEKAKVSPGTVDRVLHNRGEVSEATRRKILKIIREGSYEPNIFARNLVLNMNYKIVSLLPSHSSGDYWASQAFGIQQAFEELKAFGIQSQFRYFDEADSRSFTKAALEALEINPQGIILAPIIYHKARWFTELCHERNLPVIIIDSDISTSEKLAFVGQNAFDSGRLAAKLLDYGSGSQVFHLVTITKTTDINDILKQRKEGFHAYLKGREGVRIVQTEIHEEEGNFDKEIHAWAAQIKEGDKIFVPNSKVHKVADALKEKGLGALIRMVGYDLIPRNIQHLKDGVIDFLINQKPELQGYQGIRLLYNHLVLKQEVQKEVFMPLEIVTNENVAYVVG